jgi:Domain of unknown function (DUF1932)
LVRDSSRPPVPRRDGRPRGRGRRRGGALGERGPQPGDGRPRRGRRLPRRRLGRRALVAESEVILSICPSGIAEEVAGAVADAGFEGVYVEANAIAPARAERIAVETGLRVVDGGIIARTNVNLYLSGVEEEVAAVAGLFEGSDVDAIPFPGGIGAASALKMAFGGWNKIGVLLAAQSYAIARAYGVAGALAGEGVGAEGIPRAGPKAWRWQAEMEEIAATCAALGLPEGLGKAAAEVCERWARHRGRAPELSELLDDLSS